MDGMPPDNGYLPPLSSVQIKTAKMQKHLYCPVFTSACSGLPLQAFSLSFIAADEHPTHCVCRFLLRCEVQVRIDICRG